ncbi:unnamed protein product, partial [Protopolystoma xenopodis]
MAVSREPLDRILLLFMLETIHDSLSDNFSLSNLSPLQSTGGVYSRLSST